MVHQPGPAHAGPFLFLRAHPNRGFPANILIGRRWRPREANLGQAAPQPRGAQTAREVDGVEWVTQFNWLDWTLTLGLLVALSFGYMRGFLGTVVGLVGYVVALIAAGRFAGPLVAWADRAFGATARVSGYLERYVDLPPELSTLSMSAIPAESLAQHLESLPVPPEYREALRQRLLELVTSDSGRTVAEWILDLLARGIMAAAAFILIVTAVTWGLVFLSRRMGGLLDATPGLGAMNHLMGALIGGLSFLLSATVVIGLLAPVVSLPAMGKLAAAMESSQLGPSLLALYAALARWLTGHAAGFFLFI